MTVKDIAKVVSIIAPSYPVFRVELFGSYACGQATDTSDIDLLVYFDETKATLFDLSGLKLDIEDMLHLKVDIVVAPLKQGSYLTIDRKVPIYEA